jgi:hypothetical protein
VLKKLKSGKAYWLLVYGGRTVKTLFGVFLSTYQMGEKMSFIPMLR